MRFPWATDAAIILTVICVIGAVLLVAAPRPDAREDVALPEAANAQPESLGWPQPAVNKAVASKTPQAQIESETNAPDALTTLGPSALRPAAHEPAAAASVEAPVVASAVWPASDVTEKAEAQTASVTITGCLDLDDERFRLKDTAGDDAPQSRSWKSGFLKKRPAPIELVDTHNTLKLPTYVGHRVAATGMLVDREMQVRSVRWVPAGSCS